MPTVGIFQAKNRLSELVERAEKGEETTITRRGQPVAKIVSAAPTHDVEKAKAAVRTIRALAQKMDLGPFDWEEWKGYRDEGRG